MLRKKLLVIMMLLGLGLLDVPAAQAQEEDNTGGFSPMIFVPMIDVPLIVTGAVYAIGNTVYLVDGERSSAGWRYGAWVIGGLNLAAGVLSLLLYNAKQDTPYYLWQGVINLGIGALDIGLPIWSLGMPEPGATSATVGPLMIQDLAGNPVAGIGFSLSNW